MRALTYTDCLSEIAALAPRAPAEYLPIDQALGRFAAAPVVAPADVPGFARAAVDGYAFAREAAAEAGFTLPVSGRIAAGDPPAGLVPGTALRIFTGAMVPAGADTIAMQEDCTVSEGEVRLPDRLQRGANIRRAGEDLAAGELVVEAGATLRPQELAALASLGAGDVLVRAPVRVTFLSCGAELVSPGAPPRAASTYDSNRVMLKALSASLPVAISDGGLVPDRPDAVTRALDGAARGADLIVTSGGASHGEEDHVVAALAKLGSVRFRGARIKPGRPVTLGQIGDCAVLALPGNPVAAFICFLLFGRPAITRIGGGRWHEPERIRIAAGFSYQRTRGGRREFLRGWIETGESGSQRIRKFDRDSSGLITSLRQAAGLIEIDEEVQAIAEGDPVSFIPFPSFGIAP